MQPVLEIAISGLAPERTGQDPEHLIELIKSLGVPVPNVLDDL